MNENENYKGGLVYSEKISKSRFPFLALWKVILFDSNQSSLLAKLFLRSFAAGKDIPKVFIYKKLKKLEELTYNVLKSWASDILKILECQIFVRGLHNIEKNRNYLFISNHVSPIDIPLIYSTIPVLGGFVSNIELSYLPVFNYWMRKSSAIFVKIGNEKSEAKALKKLISNLQNGINQIIFPEGKMSPDGNVKEFNKGGIIAALVTKTPILPIYIKGTRECLKPGDFNFNKGVNLYIDYNKPIETSNLNKNEKKDFVNYLNSIYKNYEENFANIKDSFEKLELLEF